MTTKELAEFFGKSKQTILNKAKECGILIEHGKEKEWIKDEVELLSKKLYSKMPIAIKESIDYTFSTVKNYNSQQIENLTVNDLKPMTNVISQYVTKDDLKEFAKVIVQETMNNIIPLLQNKSEPKQIENKIDKLTTKEYCQKNKITDYNLNSFYIQVGRLCSKMSRELYRSVDYVKEGDYAVSKYDEDIIKHCVDIIKIENEKKNSLFNYYN